MFKITSLNQNLENKKALTSGLTFGFLEKELVFKLEMEGAEEPLFIKFWVKRDQNKGSLEFGIGDIQNNELDVYYYNPPKSGTTGITTPVGLVHVGVNVLAIMFFIEILPDSQAYKFTYEFYHGTFEIDGGTE